MKSMNSFGDNVSRRAFDVTRQRLLYMHCEYRHYMNRDAREMTSAGLVPSYSLVTSGKTNRTSDFVAMQGIALANMSPEERESLRWIDCAWRVFMRGTGPVTSKEKLRLNERRNRSTVSYVLYHKAFLGMTFRRIAELGLPSGAKVSIQRLHDYWNLAVEEVAKEARKDGLV